MARSRRAGPTPVSWEEAPEIREIAGELIEQYHGHLRAQPLDYCWRSTAAKGRGGASRRSRIVVISGPALQLSDNPLWAGKERIYLIEIPRSLWHRWSEDMRVATVDMCLSRLQPGQHSLTLVDLEVADIARFIQRHGLFDDAVRNLAKSVIDRQHELDFSAHGSNGNGHVDPHEDLTGAEVAVPAGDR